MFFGEVDVAKVNDAQEHPSIIDGSLIVRQREGRRRALVRAVQIRRSGKRGQRLATLMTT